ncbi:MAG TPA: hypothetical protein DCY13_03595 [Verrucomicrobiales bacterium]|nr:hypothetical protein [Verrucomicrobiales bacterium]
MLLVSLVAPATLLAQQPDRTPAVPEHEALLARAKAEFARIQPHFVFDGLPLVEVVDRLRNQYPTINFILLEEAQNVLVNLKLNQVSLAEALQALEIATAREHLKIVVEGPRLVRFEVDAHAPPVVEAPILLRAFNLAGYLQHREPAEREVALKHMHELLREAVELMQRVSLARNKIGLPAMKIHAGTQMLIASGKPEELAILQEIIHNLPGMEPGYGMGHPGATGGYGGESVMGGGGMMSGMPGIGPRSSQARQGSYEDGSAASAGGPRTGSGRQK